MGLCRFDPCVFSLAVAVPATRNRFVRFAIFSFSLGLPSATKSILAVPASDAIFLRFRWGSVVLGVLEGASSNGFVFSLMDSKGNVRHFFGVVFAWHGLESCCCSAVLEGASSNGFVSSLMDSKGNVRHFFGVVFAWHGLESCCCSGVSEPASKGLAPMVSELRPQLGCRTKELFFMGSKGDGKHFVGLRFAWHGLESCCCSSVSEPASKGLAPKRQAFSHARALPF